jgi:hypothetical protein
MPPIFIATDLAEGRLVTVLDQWAPTPRIGFFLYYPSRRQMRPALKALVDFLREERPGSFAFSRQRDAMIVRYWKLRKRSASKCTLSRDHYWHWICGSHVRVLDCLLLVSRRPIATYTVSQLLAANRICRGHQISSAIDLKDTIELSGFPRNTLSFWQWVCARPIAPDAQGVLT